MLCDHCVNLPADWIIPRTYDIAEGLDNEPEHWWTYSSWSELETSAASCELCALLVQESIIDPSGPYKKTDLPGVRLHISGSRVEAWCVELNRISRLNIGFDLKDVHRAPIRARKLFDCRRVSKRAGDENNIRTISHWIQVCETHETCSHSGKGNLPTRVLDVGTIETQSLRLHSNPDEVADFVSLSYCWGKGNTYTTIKANLQSHLSSIDFNNLPSTLRDAVTLTRLLGMRYLWIDALCIVQDDPDDWAREASKMHKIYSQAKLTIAADVLPDSTSSLFRDRSDRHDQVIAVPWPFEDSDGPLNLYISPRFKNFETEMASSHLSKRGWCFQERALGTRILHMGEEMCFWECKEACVGEDDEIGKYSVQDGFYHLKDVMFPPKDGRELTKLRMIDKWAWVIEEFSKRLLTYEGDKFAALEGVTTLFAGKEKLGSHLCGLWENEFLRQLLWCSFRDGTSTHRRPAKYRAPTWSWASIEGPVKNPFIQRAFVRTTEGLQMLDELGNDGKMGEDNLLTQQMLIVGTIQVETDGPTVFGSVLRGHIQATGIVVPILRGMRLNEVVDLVQTLDGEVVGGAIWDIHDEGPRLEEKLWICPIMLCKGMLDGLTSSECLVLKSSDDSEGKSMSFERVAKARIKNFFLGDFVMQQFTLI